MTEGGNCEIAAYTVFWAKEVEYLNIGIMHLVSVGSWDWVADTIRNTAESINNMLSGIVKIMQDSSLFETIRDGVVSSNVGAAIKGVALTLVTLFFLIDFLHKSLDLKWVTWENVMMFFLKVVLAKVCVDNADFIMSCIYNGFNSLITAVSPDTSIIPVGDAKEMYGYFLSSGDVQNLIDKPHVKWYDFTPVGLWLLVTIQGFIMKGIMAITLVIVLARLMELAVYTLAAPLPLATLGCDGLQDVGKSYLKSYAACCIHAMVILMIFMAYGAVNTALNQTLGTVTILGHDVPYSYTDMFNLGGFMGLIKAFILGGAVMKSEQWAKRICGAM